MIVTEELTINGMAFVRTYSDLGFMVEREGIRYSEAVDPAQFDRTYTETDEYSGYAPNEATEADYIRALQTLGVEV